MNSIHRLYINGEFVESTSHESLTITNPATLEPLGKVPNCNIQDVDRAVKAAANAQYAWWKTPGAEKAKLLREVGARIRAAEQELSTLMTRETGKPLCESVDEIDWVAACFEYYAEVARSSYGNSIPPVAPHQINFTIKEPYGVVAAIVPFNFPLLLMSWKVAPALAAGNTLVCKAPHQNPLSSLLLAKCYEGLPAGTVNILSGDGSTGEALVEHPKTDFIAFTGSTDVGRKIASTAGRLLKKVNLELGSVDPFLVFDDADLDIASRGVAWARLLNAGQVCTSSKRIYVDEKIYKPFLEKITTHIKTLRLGDPINPHFDLGPLISAQALDKVDGQVTQSLQQGARLHLGGKRCNPNGLRGHFYEPTILTDVRHGSLPTREEIFGPVLSITTFKTVEEAIFMANDSEFGLGACIYTKSLETSMRAMENIKAGTFWINDPLTDNDAGPFGGMRHSGIGRELGAEGLDAFREPKHVHLDYVMEAKNYWYPYQNRKIHFLKEGH